MSHSRIILRALPNVEFVHGYPGIPASPERPQATIRGTIEVRLGNQPVKAKWIKVDLRKVETIPSGSSGEEFIDFVGNPITVWQAQQEEEILSSKDVPFNIRVPETIPPSVALGRGAGIKYEVVATLCMKGKKGVFRREASTTISNSVAVVIDKHELHSTWPVYAQPESRQVTFDGLTLVVNRSNTCFAPADRLGVMATLKSDNLSPVVLRGFEFSLKETIIYRGGPQSHGKKNGPQVHTLVLGEQRVPVSMTLYGGTQHKAELGCIIPRNHTTSSVNAGRHIDIGYTVNVKAILDKANPIAMDLPVTITNWPRHVSVDMIKRIGTAPNLSLTLPGGSRIPAVAQASDLIPNLGHPRLPPVGGLANSPSKVVHQTVPPGALAIGPPGSPVRGSAVNGENPYAPGVYGATGQVPQRSLSTGAPQVHHTSQSMGSFGTAGGNFGTAGPKKETFSVGKDFSVPSGPATEFGYHRPGNDHLTTSYQSQDNDSGVIDVANRTGPVGTHQVSIAQATGSESDIGGATRTSTSQHAADVRPNISNPISSTRRPRTMSRTLQIVNATEEIPEDDSPVKDTTSKAFRDNPLSPQRSHRSVSPPVTQTSSIGPWPTAEQEKHRLFDRAKAQAEKVQARARMNTVGGGLSQGNSPAHSNGRSSVEQPVTAERPRTASPSSLNSSWSTAEDEKRRLFEQAQINVRRTQAMAKSAHSSPANGSVARLTHHRTSSANSSQDSGKRPYMANSPPTISAGAALYSHAIASMKSPTMAAPNVPQTGLPIAHIPASQMASSSNVSSSVNQNLTAEEEKAALRYREAKKAVERRLKEDDVPQEAPIAYEALFPPGRSDAASPSPQDALASEKEVLRRAFETRDAAIATSQSFPPPLTHLAMSNGTQPHTRAISPLSPPEPPSEKELLVRQAFEARDAAIMRSGQAPVDTVVSVRPPSRQFDVPGSSSASSHTEPKERMPLSEKEQMRLAFEKRDRALAAQQGQLPPEYGVRSPVFPAPAPLLPPSTVVGDGPLTAAQEKSQLKARFAQQDADSSLQTEVITGVTLASLPAAFEHASSPTEGSHMSESHEGYLRRDPTISAGKKRASQSITPPPPPPPPLPPPLLPRPPLEYIEETKLEDIKNNSQTVTLGPIDFSSPLDLNFSPIYKDHGASSSPSVFPEFRSGPG